MNVVYFKKTTELIYTEVKDNKMLFNERLGYPFLRYLIVWMIL